MRRKHSRTLGFVLLLFSLSPSFVLATLNKVGENLPTISTPQQRDLSQNLNRPSPLTLSNDLAQRFQEVTGMTVSMARELIVGPVPGNMASPEVRAGYEYRERQFTKLLLFVLFSPEAKVLDVGPGYADEKTVSENEILLPGDSELSDQDFSPTQAPVQAP